MAANNQNFPFIRALARQSVDYTPIWIMRQAGRYLPEYREIRAKVKDFLTLCKTPELACEVTLQPIKRFALDAAIIFSDILTIPDAMGLGLEFHNNEGPRFQSVVQDPESISKLIIPDVAEELAYVMAAIKLVKQELQGKLPLIGFSGSPWTLATYMVEGGSSKTFSQVKKLLFTEPAAFTQLLEKLVTAVSIYLKEQINAGVDAVMLFDTWGGLLTPHDYQQYSLQPMREIIKNLKAEHADIPVIMFTKNGGLWLHEMMASGADAIGLDWTIDIGVARKEVNGQVVLQGNMDPSILYAKPERIRQEVLRLLESYGHFPGHIFNLGHGIYPDVPPENVAILVDSVHELSRGFHLK